MLLGLAGGAIKGDNDHTAKSSQQPDAVAPSSRPARHALKPGGHAALEARQQHQGHDPYPISRQVHSPPALPLSVVLCASGVQPFRRGPALICVVQVELEAREIPRRVSHVLPECARV